MEINENPLKQIFQESPKGETIVEIKSLEKISLFFKNITEEKISSESRSSLIEELIKMLQLDRYISEYFSTFEDESIYLILIKLYLDKSSNPTLKKSILNLISELRINIDIDKNICDFIFQKMSLIYRGSDDLSKDNLKEYLILLDSLFGDTINKQKPRNYFACSGKGFFEVDMSNLNLNVGYCITFILNFRIRDTSFLEGNDKACTKCNLINISFSNGYSVDFDLDYPMFFVVKEIQDEYIKSFPVLEWINLVVNIIIEDKKNIKAYFYTNGENSLVVNNFKNSKLVNSGTIKTIKFFNNFHGEVSSMTFLSQKDVGYPGVNSNDFLIKFKTMKEGLWKQKKLNNFIQILYFMLSWNIRKYSTTMFWNILTFLIIKRD